MLNRLFQRQTFLRRYILPKTIYGRLIALIIVPVIMVQIITLIVFYDRHWKQATRSLSNSIVQEIQIVIKTYAVDNKYSKALSQSLNMAMIHKDTSMPKIESSNDPTGSIFVKSFNSSKMKIDYDYNVSIRFVKPNSVNVSIGNEYEYFSFIFNEYRLYTTVTAKLVWMWTIFAGVLFTVIAIAVARNQAVPITNLAKSMIAYSKGQKKSIEGLPLRGSNEVRTAIHNFKIMARRITLHQQQRTDMLSGISHDLRTPLTRMKLILAMMKKDKNSEGLKENVSNLEEMINSYLAFARGEKSSIPELIHLHVTLKQLVNKWKQSGRNITFIQHNKVSVEVGKVAIIRMFENIISNAMYYGGNIVVKLSSDNEDAIIEIKDDGCGIPKDKLKEVFSPFVRLEESRNKRTGGVGLGLSIALDIATTHGGTITLSNYKEKSGLIVIIRLPISLDA